MRVNIACGQHKLFGFINVDADPWARPDVVAVPMDLPFERGSVREIHAARVLEHLADPVAALDYWRGLLTANGVLWVAVTEAHIAGVTSTGEESRSLSRLLLGGPDESRPHHCFSPYFLALCLGSSGFGEIIRVPVSPYVEANGPRLLTFRASRIHPVRRLARRLLLSSSHRSPSRRHDVAGARKV